MGNQNSAKKTVQTAQNPPTQKQMERLKPKQEIQEQHLDSDDETVQEVQEIVPSKQTDMPFCIRDHLQPLAASRPLHDARGCSQESLQVVLTQHQELTLKNDEDTGDADEGIKVVEISYALGDDIRQEMNQQPQPGPPVTVKRYFSAKAKTEDDWNLPNPETNPKPQTSTQLQVSKKLQPTTKSQENGDWDLGSKVGGSKEDSRSQAQTRDSTCLPDKDSLELVTSASQSKCWSQTTYSTHVLILKPSIIFELLGSESKKLTIFKDEDFKHNLSNLIGHQRCRAEKDKKKL